MNINTSIDGDIDISTSAQINSQYSIQSINRLIESRFYFYILLIKSFDIVISQTMNHSVLEQKQILNYSFESNEFLDIKKVV